MISVFITDIHLLKKQIRRETMKKEEKTVYRLDGFTLTKEVYEQIKDTYINIPSEWEEEILSKMMKNCVKLLKGLDVMIGVEDYSPSTSSDEMFVLSHKLVNDPITQKVLGEDEVKTEKLLEILTGIKSIYLEKEVKDLIGVYIDVQKKLDSLLYH